MLLELAQKICQKFRQGHQSNNEFYVIYKSGPFMSESRFLEALLVRSADGELKKSSVYHPIFSLFPIHGTNLWVEEITSKTFLARDAGCTNYIGKSVIQQHHHVPTSLQKKVSPILKTPYAAAGHSVLDLAFGCRLNWNLNSQISNNFDIMIVESKVKFQKKLNG